MTIPGTSVPAYIFAAASFFVFALAAVYLYRASHLRRSRDTVEVQLLLEAAKELVERREAEVRRAH